MNCSQRSGCDFIVQITRDRNTVELNTRVVKRRPTGRTNAEFSAPHHIDAERIDCRWASPTAAAAAAVSQFLFNYISGRQAPRDET